MSTQDHRKGIGPECGQYKRTGGAPDGRQARSKETVNNTVVWTGKNQPRVVHESIRDVGSDNNGNEGKSSGLISERFSHNQR